MARSNDSCAASGRTAANAQAANVETTSERRMVKKSLADFDGSSVSDVLSDMR
ncbi:MAG: hypothetical protein ACHQWU_01340 [Gemmatimonadales bacterium]